MNGSISKSTKELFHDACSQLEKALKHLEYSYKKALPIVIDEEKLEDEEILETFDGLTARFARATDIFVSKCLKSYVMIHELIFRKF